jgi:hypothetical protein
MRLTPRVLLLLATLPLASCRAATEIRVEVTTDVLCTPRTSTIIAVGTVDSVEAKIPTTSTLTCVDGHIGSLVIVPSGDDGAEVAIRVVTASGKDPDLCARDGYAGCIVARRAVRFLPHTALTMRVPLRGSCTGVACVGDGDFSTCLDGRCVAATIPDPGTCTGSGCGEGQLPAKGSADAGTPDASLEDARAPDAGEAGGTEAGGTNGAWIPMASASTVGLEARTDSAGVWTGSRLLVWGGAVMFGYAGDGATYDPVTDRWAALPSTTLSARDLHTMVWSGTEAILWGGGYLSDGARYDPAKGAWRALEAVPATTAGRNAHVAVWATTTNEMLVWGGKASSGKNLADGAAYDPVARKWRVMAPSPLTARDGASAVWNGTRMIVFGGFGCSTQCDDAAAYNPKLDIWSAVAPPPPQLDARAVASALATGPSRTLATFYGGGIHGLDTGRTTGATYDATRDAWTPIEGPGAVVLPDPARFAPAAWSSGDRMWIWGGYTVSSGDTAHDDGAVYDFATTAWAPMPAGGPARRAHAVTVWTGTEAIVWSGEDGAASATVLYNDGKRFRP